MSQVSPKSQAFPKSHRLLKRAEFLAVQRAGGGARSRHFVALIRFRDDDDPCRLGVVASKRIGNAVARNRGKRRVREWFRRRDDLPRGTDLVIILRGGSPDLPFAELCAELDEASTRVIRKARKSLKRRGSTTPATGEPEARRRGKGPHRG
ncbi:MAG: ribonuclease P protein component [Polyangiaceae bacterium]